MIPLRDDIPSSKFPIATLSIIVINVLVFLHELRLGPHLEDLFSTFAVIPARYTDTEAARFYSRPELVFAIFSSMFLHGGWLHLLGNMWTLWIFGDNVEDRLGRTFYVILYLAGGVAAALMYIY